MCVEDEEFYPTGGHASGQAPWTVSVGDCDWLHPWDCATSLFDAIKTIPGIGDVAQLAEDFSNTAIGKAFFAIIAPEMATEIFTQLPGIGMNIANGLGTLGPVAKDMLPGLVRGERVDKAFVASLKSVVSRAASAGGGDAGAEASKIAGPAFTQATGVANEALGALGTTPAQIASISDDFRRQAGLTTADQILPPALKAKFDAAVKPYLAQLDVKTLAARAGVPDDVMAVAIDGVTRTANYSQDDFSPDDGHLMTNAEKAVRAVDAMILDGTIGGHVEVVFGNGLPLPQTIGGRFPTSSEVLSGTSARAGEFGGEMGRLANATYISSRLRALAAQGLRPEENLLGTVAKVTKTLGATASDVDDYLTRLVGTNGMHIRDIPGFAKKDPLAPAPLPFNQTPAPGDLTVPAIITRLQARSKWLRSQYGAHVAGALMTAMKPIAARTAVKPAAAPTTTLVHPAALMAIPPVPPQYLALADKIDAAIAYETNLQALQGHGGFSMSALAKGPLVVPVAPTYDRLAERAKWTAYFLGFSAVNHAAGGRPGPVWWAA